MRPARPTDGPESAALWLAERIEAVRGGALPRRRFLAEMAALGVTAPVASLLLADAGLAQTAAPPMAYPPTRRGGGGTLRILIWQAPTLLNPHFALGQKDQEAARLFYEPLIAWDDEGNMVPMLAAEIPSRANGGVAADGRSVTWKLKPGVSWHDGQPFGADDVVFNADYARDPAAATLTGQYFEGLQVEKVDALTVRVRFDKPQPFWPGSYSGVQLVPKHLFEPYRGARSRQAPANLAPVGTGPYKFVEFKPGDLVTGALYPAYHMPNRPFFDRVEMKGGGDAVSAARAVLQTGEFDFAWNLQVEDEILKRLEAGGRGHAFVPKGGGGVEYMVLNSSDPRTMVDGELSSPRSHHPLLSDPAVREALALLLDRRSVETFIYGRAGKATANILNAPARFRSPNQHPVFDIAKANAVLEAAGWKRGSDGIRAKDGKALKLLFQTAINAPRQKTQAVYKQAARQAGIAIEIKAVPASVFFSSDEANPDTNTKFQADLEMFTLSMGRPDPGSFMRQFLTSQIPSKANKWVGLNCGRWQNAAYDAAYRASESELDDAKRVALLIRMNDLVCGDHAVIPIVERPLIVGIKDRLVAPQSGWDLTTGFIHDWYRQA